MSALQIRPGCRCSRSLFDHFGRRGYGKRSLRSRQRPMLLSFGTEKRPVDDRHAFAQSRQDSLFAAFVPMGALAGFEPPALRPLSDASGRSPSAAGSAEPMGALAGFESSP